MKLNQPLWGWQLILVSHLSFGHGNQVRNADKFCTIKRKYFDFSVSCSFVWLTKDRSMQGLVKGAILCFRNPYFYFLHGESTSTASQLTSPASQKSKDLNKVSLLLQDLAKHRSNMWPTKVACFCLQNFLSWISRCFHYPFPIPLSYLVLGVFEE